MVLKRSDYSDEQFNEMLNHYHTNSFFSHRRGWHKFRKFIVKLPDGFYETNIHSDISDITELVKVELSQNPTANKIWLPVQNN
jgi:hypothetical protein